METLAGVLMVMAAIFVVPTLVARFAVGGGWSQVGGAYLLWFGLLALTLLVPGSGTYSEKFGWMVIMAIFLSIVAIPVLTLVQRVGSWMIEAT